MNEPPRRRWLRVTAVAATVWGAAWLAFGRDGPNGRIEPPTGPRRLDANPLDCRIEPVDEAGRRATLGRSWFFREHPDRLDDRAVRNPLIAGDVVVVVRNTSGQTLELPKRPDGHRFLIEMDVRDGRGNPVAYRKLPTGLKELGLLQSGHGAPVVPLAPGASERQAAAVFARLDAREGFEPGRYAVRAVARYLDPGRGLEARVTSEPVWVTVTKADLRGWRRLHLARSPTLEGWFARFF